MRNKDDFHRVFIYWTPCEEIEHKGKVIHAQLRVKEREEVKDRLKFANPRDIHMELIKNAELEIKSEGNTQKCCDLKIIHKAKSEIHCQSDTNGLESMHLPELFQKYINDQKKNNPFNVLLVYC